MKEPMHRGGALVPGWLVDQIDQAGAELRIR